MTDEIRPEFRQTKTIFVVDDDSAIRDGLRDLFESVGLKAETFGSAEEFMSSDRVGAAGCLVLDARLPGITGVELQDNLLRAGIATPIVFMTAHGDIPMVRKVLKAGAVEFLTKPFDKEELFAAVGRSFEIDEALRGSRNELALLQARLEALTRREREVMELVTAGLLNKQIAAELGISEIMVKLHRRRALEKMQANSVADLVKMTEKLNFLQAKK